MNGGWILTFPPATTGAFFLLHLHGSVTGDMTLQAQAGSVFGGASGNGTNVQTVRRSFGITWLCHSEGQSWGLSCIPNVNSNGTLQVGGYTAGIRPFVSCAVSAAGTLYWSRGQTTARVERTINGYAWGDYTVKWDVDHPDGADYVPQFCALNNWAFIQSGARTARSIQIKATDGSGGVLDRDFCLTIH